ncbi:MAG: aminotransferase class V-fold PLP-dependent enzyme [Planctomycetes bacterium]|nr:aminotransferase class V-fold PLP-dependent enzyme [Planctomycetota bacterium]
MYTRREMLGAMTAPVAAATAMAYLDPLKLSTAMGEIAEIASQPGSAAQIAGNEDFWAAIARAFTVDRSIINFNNGGVSPAPDMVQESMKRHLDFSNSTPPPIALWQVLEPRKEPIRQRMAQHWGVDPEEIAFTRNTSESLQICQFGIDLKAGDEVLTTDQDYGRMINTFKQREKREGVVLRQFSMPVPNNDDDEIVRRFEQNITPRTKMILMVHIVNLTGQILPVRRVVQMARKRGIPVVVDGAHSLAHFSFKISDLDCDYYGTSLHKWLFAPHGTGLLYVRRNKIKGLWPLMAANENQVDDIRKFEEIGTHPAANILAIAEALTFHQLIGDERKEKRLHFLKMAWADRLMGFSDRIRLNTSLDPKFSCGIANVYVEGIETSKLQQWLWKDHQILTVAINHEQFNGLRISPSVYTTMEEIDRFCDAMEHAITNGLPA